MQSCSLIAKSEYWRDKKGGQPMPYMMRENRQQIYYEDYGKGPETIVLLHAWGLSSRAWDSNVNEFVKAGYRVITLDARGCGRSDKDFVTMTLDALAGDVVALLESLEIEAAVVNGWSMGGAVAVMVAELLGNRCRGLVLTAAATPVYTRKPGIELGIKQEDFQQIVSALEADRPSVLQNLAQGCVAPNSNQMLTNWIWHIFMESSASALDLLLDLANVDQRDTLKTLDLPVLACIGTQDTLIDPDICRSVSQFHEDTTAVEFMESSHSPPLEESTKYNEAVLGFMSNVWN